MVSVCRHGVYVVIGAIAMAAGLAAADVSVSFSYEAVSDQPALIGVDERVFDPGVLYVSPDQIKILTRVMFDDSSEVHLLSVSATDDGYTIQVAPKSRNRLSFPTITLDWKGLTIDSGVDGTLQNLIKWDQPGTKPFSLSFDPIGPIPTSIEKSAAELIR